MSISAPGNAETIEVTADGPAGILAGTLEVADEPRAVALILPGSGPTDRNGNSTLGIEADSYRLLAEALAAQGITTLRIDKRGIGGSGGDGNDVSLAAYREDTATWLETLAAYNGAECVWLIGHSEGGVIALAAADLAGVCGLVLLTAPGRPLGRIMIDQFRANPALAAFMDDLEGAIGALETGDTPDTASLPLGLALLFQPPVVNYLRELVQTDPAELIAETSLPVLLVTGDADLQIRPNEADPLVAARPDAEAVTLAGMNHMLKPAPTLEDAGDMQSYVAANLETYNDPTIPLHSDLIPTLTRFILADR